MRGEEILVTKTIYETQQRKNRARKKIAHPNKKVEAKRCKKAREFFEIMGLSFVDRNHKESLRIPIYYTSYNNIMM